MADTKKPGTSSRDIGAVSNDSMRTIVHEAIEPFAKRLDDLEVDVRGLRSDVTRWRAEEAESISRVASGAARAVDIALKAQSEASSAKADVTNIVASALKIHGASIAQTVDGAVKAAVGPLVKDVEALKDNDGDQNTTLAAQNRGIVVIARELGVEEKLDPTLRGSLPPPKDNEKRAPVFPALESRLRNSQIVQLLVAIAIFLRIIWEIVAPHH